MVLYCFVEGCKSKKYCKKGEISDSNLQFYGFPSCQEVREVWVKAFRLNNQEITQFPKTSRICNLHFSLDCFKQCGLSSRLKPNSVPSIFPRAENQNQSLEISTESCPKNNDLNDEIMNSDKDVNEYILQTPKKLVRYPGDIDDNVLQTITPKTSQRIIKMLKQKCQEKDKIIKRCRTQQSRQKKKIESLSRLLLKLKKEHLLSENSCDIMQVS